MKLRLPLFLLFFITLTQAQQNVGKKVKALVDAQTNFVSFSLLNEIPDYSDKTVSNTLASPVYAQLDINLLHVLIQQRHEYLELNIPYLDTEITVQLYRVNPLAQGFHVDSDKRSFGAYDPGLYYRGCIKGQVNTLVSFNFFEGKLNGILSGNGHNIVIGKLKNSSTYVIYSDAKMNINSSFACNTADNYTIHQHSNRLPSQNSLSSKCATMYFEIDHNLYLENGSDLNETTDWMTSVFNNVQTIFENDGITVSLKSIFIWTSPDPYEGIGNSSIAYLYKFNQVRPVFDGDLGQLVGIDPGGLGGVAVTIDGLCSAQNFSYSDVELDFQTVPTYSWTILVITHELGHLLGSPHTHACVWNGNNTAIDNCATAGLGSSAEGAFCSTNPLTIPSSGTIMSYCHLVSNVGIDLSNGFGLQPAQQILDTFDSRSCLSSDCINTCINTVQEIVVESTTLSTATLSWVDASGITSWNVRYYLNGASPGVWTTVATSSLTATNLAPNTYYVFEVTPICPNGLEIGGRKIIFMTADAFCSGSVFTDTGGADLDYEDEETLVRTIIPNIPSNNITLSFSVFDLEVDYDYMFIYNGNSTSAPEFNNGLGYTGNTIPGPFESSAADGSLTIQFKSDQFVTEAGWVAAIGCTANLNTPAFEGIDFSYYPNPSNGIVQIQSKTPLDSVAVYNVTGQKLHQEKLTGFTTQVDLRNYAVGTYFFRLQFDQDRVVHFKVIKK